MNTKAKIVSAIATTGLAATLMLAPTVAGASQQAPHSAVSTVSITDRTGADTGTPRLTSDDLPGEPEEAANPHLLGGPTAEDEKGAAQQPGEPEEAANPHLLGGPTADNPGGYDPGTTPKSAPKTAPKAHLPRVAG